MKILKEQSAQTTARVVSINIYIKMWYYREQYESGHFNDFLSSKDVKKCKCPKYVRSCEKCNVNKARNCFK